MDKSLIALLGVIIGLISYVFYFHGIWKKTVKPHGFTWLVWGVLTSVAVAAQITEKAGPGTVILLMMAAACFIFSGIGFMRREKYITRSDMAALAIALCSIPVWLMTDDPMWSVVIVSVIDAIAAFPTMRKAWFEPYSESALTFTISAVSALMGIAALSVYNVSTVLYLAAIALVNMAIVFVSLYRRWVLA